MTKKTDESEALGTKVRAARLNARRMVRALEAAPTPLDARRIVEGLEGHSTCKKRHSHYRAACCPVCIAKWGNIPKSAPSIPWDAIAEHDQANWDQKMWDLYDKENADWKEYTANWTPETCRHEFCAITDDNHEICEHCGKDVTEFDAPVEAFEEARRRLADWDAREGKAAPEQKTSREQKPPTYDLDL